MLEGLAGGGAEAALAGAAGALCTFILLRDTPDCCGVSCDFSGEGRVLEGLSGVGAEAALAGADGVFTTAFFFLVSSIICPRLETSVRGINQRFVSSTAS